MIGRLALPDDLFEVLKRLANSLDIPIEQAVEVALRDWAVQQGFLPPDDDFDEDTPTEGSA